MSLSTEENAAIAAAVLFGLFLIGTIANFRIIKFKVYLLSGLSCFLRVIGFSFRAAFYKTLRDLQPNSDYQAVAIVFMMAGFGISVAVLVLIMGVWYKNSAPTSRPPFANQVNFSVLIRWLILPIIVFGPILGICIVSLRYGVPTPSHLTSSKNIQEAATWGLLMCLIILLTSIVLATFYAFTASKRVSNPAATSADKLVGLTLACVSLLTMSSIFNTVAFYHPRYAINPDLYYPLVILPTLLELCIILYPKLMAKISLGSRYEDWVEEQKGPVQKLPLSESDLENKSEQSK